MIYWPALHRHHDIPFLQALRVRRERLDDQAAIHNPAEIYHRVSRIAGKRRTQADENQPRYKQHDGQQDNQARTVGALHSIYDITGQISLIFLSR